MLAGACTAGDATTTAGRDSAASDPPVTSPIATSIPGTTSITVATTATTTTIPATTTTTTPTFTLSGTVTDGQGGTVAGATVEAAGMRATTGTDGSFTMAGVPAGPVRVSRPAWSAVEFEWDGSSPVDVFIEPFVVRAVRVSRYNYTEGGGLDEILELVAGTAVNALVFDTKDETGTMLYETAVGTAAEVGAAGSVYDPVEALTAARAAGLYTITRIVTFEDPVWTAADPDVKLAGWWVDARNPENWEYPLALASEACALGFDEIQFDYVRFPAGQTAGAAPRTTQGERLEAIAGFLSEARRRLHDAGCAVSADIFGIVTNSPTDEGIGQRPEEVSASVDVISPMVYPSHYSPGWIGFSDPNDHPGPVTAHALNGVASRLAPGSQVRPWLQAFYYTPSQVRAAIAEAEARGVGWILWNAAGRYSKDALPAPDEIDG